MKIYLLLFLLLFSTLVFSYNEKNTESLPNCSDRIEMRVPPKFPRHQEWAIKKHGSCKVNLDLSIDENGVGTIDNSYVENPDCKNFIKNSRRSVEQYIFNKGKQKMCSLKVIFEIDGYGT